MILTFAVNGTLLDETPFFEKLKALAEEPKLDAEQVAFDYRFYQARLQYGQAYQDAKTILKQTLMLMDVQFNDRGWFARHYEELLAAQKELSPFDDALKALPLLKRHNKLYAVANTDNDIAHAHIGSDYWQDIKPAADRSWHNVWINRQAMANSRMYKHNKALPTLEKLPDYIARVAPDMEERAGRQSN